MKYAVLITDTLDSRNWTERHAARPEQAVQSVWQAVKHDSPLVMSNQRPIRDAQHDGMPVIYNRDHVVHVCAFPAC